MDFDFIEGLNNQEIEDLYFNDVVEAGDLFSGCAYAGHTHQCICNNNLYGYGDGNTCYFCNNHWCYRNMHGMGYTGTKYCGVCR